MTPSRRTARKRPAPGPGRNEDGGDVVHWWLFHAPDPDDTDALAARIDKAIQDARARERDMWADLGVAPPRREEA